MQRPWNENPRVTKWWLCRCFHRKPSNGHLLQVSFFWANTSYYRLGVANQEKPCTDLRTKTQGLPNRGFAAVLIGNLLMGICYKSHSFRRNTSYYRLEVGNQGKPCKDLGTKTQGLPNGGFAGVFIGNLLMGICYKSHYFRKKKKTPPTIG